MEPVMISLKVLSTAALMALVLPMMTPSESFAAPAGKGAGGRPAGGSFRGSPGGGPRFSGGGAPARFGAGPGGGVYRGGGGGYRGGGGGGFIPGAVAGAVIGGALASAPYGYYGDPGYYAPGYYDNGYYDPGAVAVVPDTGGGDAVAYCMQTYRSYDPRSGTYLGNDGYRHPCP
jgi:hypothetical protein